MDTEVQRFRLAPMSRSVQGLTVGLLALPAVLLAGAAVEPALTAPALICFTTYGWIWLRFRPTRFAVHPDTLEVVWPLKRRELTRDGIAGVRLIDRHALRRDAGWCVRIGAGGLWGAFGWLWTRRRGIVQMYVSRTDHLVWIERPHGRPWLVTPERPEAFVRALDPQLSGTTCDSRV